MSIWDWIHEYRTQALENGDEERLRMTSILDEAHPFFSTDPEQALLILAEGRQLARTLGETRWELFFSHWEIQVRLHYLNDYRGLLERTLEATLQASKPQFTNFPQRVCLQEDLIAVYQHIDPLGYDDKVEEAVRYMEETVTPDMECWFCTLGCRISLERDRKNWEQAHQQAMRYLETAEDADSDFSRSSACWYLCNIALKTGNDEDLITWAEVGEEVSRRANRPGHTAQFLMFQALALRRRGEEEKAQRVYRQAYTRQNRLNAPPEMDYFDAQALYHEAGGQLEKALQVRDRQLRTVKGKERLAEECEVHIARCQVLAKLGRLNDSDREQARAAARLLRKPEPYLERIDNIS